MSDLPPVGSWIKFRRFGWLPDWLSWIPVYWVWYKIGGYFKSNNEVIAGRMVSENEETE